MRKLWLFLGAGEVGIGFDETAIDDATALTREERSEEMRKCSMLPKK